MDIFNFLDVFGRRRTLWKRAYTQLRT